MILTCTIVIRSSVGVRPFHLATLLSTSDASANRFCVMSHDGDSGRNLKKYLINCAHYLAIPPKYQDGKGNQKLDNCQSNPISGQVS